MKGPEIVKDSHFSIFFSCPNTFTRLEESQNKDLLSDYSEDFFLDFHRIPEFKRYDPKLGCSLRSQKMKVVKELADFAKLVRVLHPYAGLAILDLFLHDPTRFFVEEFIAQLEMNRYQMTIFPHDPRVVMKLEEAVVGPDRLISKIQPNSQGEVVIEIGLLYEQFLLYWSRQTNHPDREQALNIKQHQFEDCLGRVPRQSYNGASYYQCRRSWILLSPLKSRL